MNLSGIVIYKNGLFDFERKAGRRYSPLSSNGFIEIELFTGEDDKISNSIIVQNLKPDNEIQQENSILSNMEFSCLENLREYLKNNSEIKLAICYDNARKSLVTARGVLSDIPLYYVHAPNLFYAFSTSVTELINFSCVKSFTGIDTQSIKSYLSSSGPSSSYSNNTFFKEIKSVLPGHINITNNESNTSITFAQFNIEKWEHISTKEEYGETFRHLFANAIKNSVGSSKTIGAHLSGGLDSSSISAMTRNLFPDRTLHTLYSDTETTETEERHFALDVAKKICSIHHEVKAPHDEINGLIKYISICGYPPNTIHSTSRHIDLLQYQKDIGCTISLSGEGGDGVVGYGREYLDLLFDQQLYKEARIELSKLANNVKHPFFHPKWDSITENQQQSIFIENTIYRLLAQKFRNSTINKFIPIFIKLSKEFGVSPLSLLRQALLNSYNNKRSASIISKQLKSALNEELHIETILSQTLLAGLDTVLQKSYGSLFSSIAIKIREEYYALSHHMKLTTRLPFYDKELLELCMATPAVIKYDNGLKRGHLREGMKDILPESVRLRVGKATFDTFARQSTFRLYQQSLDFLGDHSPVWNYVDKKRFNQMALALKKENELSSIYTKTFVYVHRTISLAVWLDWLKRTL